MIARFIAEVAKRHRSVTCYSANRSVTNQVRSRRGTPSGSLLHVRRRILKMGLLLPPMLACQRAESMDRLVADFRGDHQAGSLADDIVWPLADDLSEGANVQTFAAREINLRGAPIIAVTSGRVDCLDTHLHDPTSCYAARGFHITRTENIVIMLPTIAFSATFLTAQQNERIDHILCWGRLNGGFPTASAMTTDALVGTLLDQPNSRLTIIRLSIRNVHESDARRTLVLLAERLALRPCHYINRTSIAPDCRGYNSLPAEAVVHAFEPSLASIL